MQALEQQDLEEMDVLAAGHLVGRYQILCKLASGGMADVYVASLRAEGGFHKNVAIKVMRSELAADERFTAMFVDEAALAVNISSPNVVTTLDLGRCDGTWFIAMELVFGATLSRLQRAARQRSQLLPQPVASMILVDAARGLADAHQARSPTGLPLCIVHRDISPQNIIVGADGISRIADFGVAHAAQRVSHTKAGEVKGKLRYCSPEQAKAAAVDVRSDVFSLGIVAWETFTGCALFGGSPSELLHQISRSEIPRADAVCPEVPAAIADVIARALVRKREDRTPTATAFERELVEAAQANQGLADAAAVANVVRDFAGEDVAALRTAIAEGLSDLQAFSAGATPVHKSVARSLPPRAHSVPSFWRPGLGGAMLGVALGVGVAWNHSVLFSPGSPEVAPPAERAPHKQTSLDPVTTRNHDLGGHGTRDDLGSDPAKRELPLSSAPLSSPRVKSRSKDSRRGEHRQEGGAGRRVKLLDLSAFDEERRSKR